MANSKKAKVLKTYITTEGTLYKDSVVRIKSIAKSTTRVIDELGKIYYFDMGTFLIRATVLTIPADFMFAT